MATNAVTDDFVIWGPSVASANALNAVHALYYLPRQYKLILPTATAEEQASYDRILSLIRRDGLDGRVQFTNKQVEADRHAVITPTKTENHLGHIFGHSPEELASAILDAARATV